MNTKINLTYNGENYTLEYDRTTVVLLENSGFKLDEFLEKPMANIELAFAGAFMKNHRKVSQNAPSKRYLGQKGLTPLDDTLRTTSHKYSE